MALTAFSDLKINALKMADHPSAGDASALDRMGIFINQSLQDLYMLAHRRMLEDKATITEVVDQEYVELKNATLIINAGAGFAIDEIVNVYQTEDDITLQRWSMHEYRRIFPDVTTNSGNPVAYARLQDRLYLYPRPSTANTLYLDVWVIAPNLAGDADTSLLTHKYDEVVLTGAVYRWYRMLEPDDSNKISAFKKIYDELKKQLEDDMSRESDMIPKTGSHKGRILQPVVWAKSPWGTA